ncbi:NHLP bacteriocin export ABC transporter permease/ATPase subunit [Streptomyces cadmiisoli]|uniref:NHLP bacteriocin export ABC transporter permease/ATPase subunit n=1 Tax=Streptomyces cadmiisoli TaxID=2184053 RepID=A0A2Z4JEG6_9ACTN|nr:NHLP bacteriocin export ABC transporter permease/ATPase subunit [Streptomyces cadmiisoli]AWW43505.1 NHLP bacteriocin export ABC transporter permease/ATPase subunit [Streptomyces cadmiisoli]
MAHAQVRSTAEALHQRWEALAQLGEHVDCSGRQILLNRQGALWLVTEGEFDLFAVDVGAHGPWHHIGRLGVGTICLAPVADAQHDLVLRPLRDAALRRLSVCETVQAMEGRASTRDTARPLIPLLAEGIDRGLAVLMDFIQEGLPPQHFIPLVPSTEVELAAGDDGRPQDGIVWVEILAGEVCSGGDAHAGTLTRGDSLTLGPGDWIRSLSAARIRIRSTRNLQRDGELWHHVAQFENRILHLVDRAIESREDHAERRINAGLAADQAAAQRAEQALSGVLQPSVRDTSRPAGGDDDATSAACRVVAQALGIEHVPSRGTAPMTKVGPIEQWAVQARLRTRVVGLKDAWWQTNIGPLVGHLKRSGAPVALLWHRGKYRAWNPATGSWTELDRSAAGEYEPRGCMLYRPLPEGAISNWRLVREGLRGAGSDMRSVALSTLIAVVLSVLVPISTGTVLGQLVPQAQRSLIIEVCIALFMATLAAAAFAVMQNVALLRLEGRFEATVQAAVWDRLLRLPMTFYRRYSTGELAGAALGVAELRTVLMGVSSTVLYASAVALVNFIVLLWISVPFGLLSALFVVIGLAAFGILGTRQMRWETQALHLGYELNNKVFQTLRGMPKLQVAAAENRAYADWAGTFSQQKNLQKRIAGYQKAITVFNAAFPHSCLLVFFIVTSSSEQALSVSEFLTFNASLTLMLAALTQVTGGVASAVAIVPIYTRLQPILQEPLESSVMSSDPGELSGDVEVSHLTFGYSQDAPPVLDDISFRVRPGEFVAVVGASGGGKSTLLRLLLGFEKPDAGTVLFDGQDLSALDSAAVRRQCGVVLQQVQPFSGSIFQAITGSGNYSMDEAWAAAELAGLREDIEAMPMNMHTLISDASTLSGGQRQRLAIAHALIRRPRILFFDEATSALDNATQQTVTEATRQLRATRIVIAHRLSTVMDADKIIVLSQGRIAQFGSPTDLLADPDGLFYQLVRRQMH